VAQFPSPNYEPSQYQNTPSVSQINYFNWRCWEVIQIALAKNPSLKLLNDGGEWNPSFPTPNIPDPTLLDYMQSMLAPKITSGNPYPYPVFGGWFNPDRLLCRNARPGTVPNQLPLQQPLFSTNFVGVYPVIPPVGYACVGQYIISHSANLSSPTPPDFNYSPLTLVFVKRDQRFVQPLRDLAAWPGITNKPSYYNLRVGNIFNFTVSQPSTNESETIDVPYTFTSLGNYLFNGLVAFPTRTNFSDYPPQFPWAVNIQLVRTFPNGPNGVETRFQGINKNRLLNKGQGISTTSSQTLPSAKVVNPLYSLSFFYPFENGYKFSDGNFTWTTVNTPGQTTYPIVLPFSLKDMLNCCTGRSQGSLIWDWSAFQPYPTGITDNKVSVSVASCQANGYSWFYKPGSDCDSITTTYCFPDATNFPQWNWVNCSCINYKKSLQDSGICPCPSTDPYLNSVQQSIATTAGCSIFNCANESTSLKLTTQVPISAPCPPLQYCIISNVNVEGDATLSNNCSQNGGGEPIEEGPSSSLNITVQAFLITAAVLFAVIAAVILLLRRRRKRKSDQLADHAQSPYDFYDSNEMEPDEFSDAFPEKGRCLIM
jgi:hypothetical protein